MKKINNKHHFFDINNIVFLLAFATEIFIIYNSWASIILTNTCDKGWLMLS